MLFVGIEMIGFSLFGISIGPFWGIIEGVAPIILAIYFTREFFPKAKNQSSKNESGVDSGNAIRNRTSHPKLKQNKFLSGLSRNLDVIALSIGGTLVALRLLFPPKYYLIRGVKLPYDGSMNYAPTVDYNATILQVLGIAVITSLIFYALRKFNKRKRESDKTD